MFAWEILPPTWGGENILEEKEKKNSHEIWVRGKTIAGTFRESRTILPPGEQGRYYSGISVMARWGSMGGINRSVKK